MPHTHTHMLWMSKHLTHSLQVSSPRRRRCHWLRRYDKHSDQRLLLLLLLLLCLLLLHVSISIWTKPQLIYAAANHMLFFLSLDILFTRFVRLLLLPCYSLISAFVCDRCIFYLSGLLLLENHTNNRANCQIRADVRCLRCRWGSPQPVSLNIGQLETSKFC